MGMNHLLHELSQQQLSVTLLFFVIHVVMLIKRCMNCRSLYNAP